VGIKVPYYIDPTIYENSCICVQVLGVKCISDVVDENTVDYIFKCPLRTITITEVNDYDQERMIESFNINGIDLEFKQI
jgi:hypothetical protein